MTLEGLMETCLDVYGTVQNQQVVSYCMLPNSTEPPPSWPFQKGRIYKIILTAQDEMVYKWCVTNIEDVADAAEPPADIPEVFLL